jgi:hypothetical protein
VSKQLHYQSTTTNILNATMSPTIHNSRAAKMRATQTKYPYVSHWHRTHIRMCIRHHYGMGNLPHNRTHMGIRLS